MLGMAQLTPPGSGRRLSTTTKPPETHHRSDSKSRQARKSSKARLTKPLSERKRCRIIKNTTRLITRRNRLNQQVLREVKKKNPSLLRDKLLTKREILSERERLHLRKRTRKLAKLKALWQRDPSSNRYNDYNLVRELFLKFKRNLGPLFEEYANHHIEKDADDDKMSPSDSQSGSEWADASESEDEQPYRSHSQNKNTVKATNKGVSLSPQANRNKRKCEEEHTESKPFKKVRFAIDEDADRQASRQEEKSKSKKKNKARQKEKAFVQEVQTNDK
ncbi:hypothetical protein F4679DRAFT_596844 [Xylaria curta]|nr:hypothetical protein F4679DRAFT_596844 [Xylaria curta]